MKKAVGYSQTILTKTTLNVENEWSAPYRALFKRLWQHHLDKLAIKHFVAWEVEGFIIPALTSQPIEQLVDQVKHISHKRNGS